MTTQAMDTNEQALVIQIIMNDTGEPQIVANGPLPILQGIAILDLAKEKMMGQYWNVVENNLKQAALTKPQLYLPTA